MYQTVLFALLGFLEFFTEKNHSVFAFHVIHVSLCISCVTCAVQVRLVLLKEVFSTSHPVQCGRERRESCFAHIFSDAC